MDCNNIQEDLIIEFLDIVLDSGLDIDDDSSKVHIDILWRICKAGNIVHYKEPAMKLCRRFYYSTNEWIQKETCKIIKCMISEYPFNDKIKELFDFYNVKHWDNHSYFIFQMIFESVTANCSVWLDDSFYKTLMVYIIRGISTGHNRHSAFAIYQSIVKINTFDTFKKVIFPSLEVFLTSDRMENR